MLKETEYELDGHTYLLTQLPLGESQDVLLRLTRLVGVDGEMSISGIVGKLRSEDINFFREKLFGKNCQFKNDSGNWVPLGKAIVETHFAGRIGTMIHLLAKCLLHNYSDFLAELRLDELIGAMDQD